VLDQQHRVVGCDILDYPPDIVDSLGGDTGVWLVEQEYVGVTRERDTDLQLAFLAVAKILGGLVCLSLETHPLQDLVGPLVVLIEAPDVAPEAPGVVAVGLLCDANVLQHRGRRKYIGYLVRAMDAELRGLVGGPVGDVDPSALPVEFDTAVAGRERPGQEVEKRRLAGAVRTDESSKSTLSTAVRPPNRFVRADVRSIAQARSQLTSSAGMVTSSAETRCVGAPGWIAAGQFSWLSGVTVTGATVISERAWLLYSWKL